MDQRGLVERARRGDHDAFAALVDLAIARLDAAARLILRDPELARDAVQEALIRAWRDLPGSSRPGPVRRLAPPTHRQRLSRPRPAPATTVRSRSSSPRSIRPRAPTCPARSPTASSLDGALRRLDPAHRAVVALHYLLGMPLPEVAASLGIPLGTAKSRLHYALAAMRTAGRGRARRPGTDRGGQAGMTTDRSLRRPPRPTPRGPVPGAPLSRLSR